MAGKIKRMLDEIVRLRSNADPTIAMTTKTKLILKGLDPDRYDATSPDDAAIIARILTVATEMGLFLK